MGIELTSEKGSTAALQFGRSKKRPIEREEMTLLPDSNHFNGSSTIAFRAFFNFYV
jgi:hypothetical protein